MNGLGLLITILFCGITYWGTSSYYKAIIKRMVKANKMLQAQLFEAELLINPEFEQTRMGK
jgi:uncharacterized membrane protein YwzB